MIMLAQLIDSVAANQFELRPGVTTIGRHPNNDIVIDDISVSSHHAKIHVENNRYLDGAFEVHVEDVGSTNGTYVNGQRVNGKQMIVNKDVISLAWTEFKLLDDSADSMEKTAYILHK